MNADAPFYWRTFWHKGDVMLVFNRSVMQLPMTADDARTLAKALIDCADDLDKQESKQSRKQ